MNKLVQCVFACLLLGVFAFVASSAQEEQPADELKLRGSIEIQLNDLIQMYSEQSGRLVMYHPGQLRQSVVVVAPNEGASPSTLTILQTALQQFSITMVSHGAFDVLVPTSQAMKSARSMSLAELDDADPMDFARVLLPITHGDPSIAAGALRHIVTSQGGLVLPIAFSTGRQPNVQRPENVRGTILVIDYVYNLREIVKLVDELNAAPVPDTGMATELITIRHADIQVMIDMAMGHGATRVTKIDDRRIVVSGAANHVERIVELMTELDVPSAD